MLPWWIPTFFGAVTTIGIGFWGWLAVKVIDQGRKLVELEQRIISRERTCSEHAAWIKNVEMKIDKVSEDTTDIRVALGISRHK